jgi:hypothetical protein
MRTTDNGLSSSRGAPRANHDRVLGNILLRTAVPDGNAALVTDVGAVAVGDAHPRQVEPRPEAPCTTSYRQADLPTDGPGPAPGTQFQGSAVVPAGPQGKAPR